MLCLHSRLPLRYFSATTKAAVQGYPHKAASICFAVYVSLPVFLFSNLVATYTSELNLPIAQCQVSHQGLYVMILNVLGYELLIA